MVEALTAFMEKLTQADKFSGAVLVARHDEPIFRQAYGLASQGFGVPNTVDTKFNLGSMNKMFTAVAITQLAEQGKLHFDDIISTYLPDYPPEVASKVSIHHLLTHTSGMGSYWNDKFEASKTKLRTLQAYLALFVDDPLMFEPGTRFEYSNAGYIVLGAIIEQVSGQTYFDYVREQICNVAGMPSTAFYELDQDTPNLAFGYTSLSADGTLQPGPRRNNLLFLPAKGGPAGGGYSTVDDLLAFAIALRTHRLLESEHTATMLTGKAAMGPTARYAYGFGDVYMDGMRIVGHNGGFAGVHTQLDIYLDHGYTVVVLANYDPPTGQPVIDKIRQLIGQASFGDKL